MQILAHASAYALYALLALLAGPISLLLLGLGRDGEAPLAHDESDLADVARAQQAELE